MNQNNECHIVSLILLTKPDMVDTVAKTIEQFPIAEVAAVDQIGKLIILLETEDEELLNKTMDQFRLIEHVQSVALVYHQIDRESATV
jgi:nitrate reductase NapD